MFDPVPPEPRVQLSTADLTIGADLAGRDKIVTTTTTTTTIVGGGRLAVLALAGVAALAVTALAVLAARPARTAALPPAATTITAAATATLPVTSPPSATATLPSPTLTPPSTLTPVSPGALATQPFEPTDAPPLPAPAPAPLPLYDAFDNGCLDAARWSAAGASAAPAGPCLDADWPFLTEGRDHRLAVFLSLETAQDAAFTQNPAGCFQAAAVTLALNPSEVYGGPGQVYLSVGLRLPRVGRMAGLEVRVQASTQTGRLVYALAPRYSEPGGTWDFAPLPYVPGRPVTLTFATDSVGASAVDRAAGVNYRLTLAVDGQPVEPALSLSGYPCALALGYHADPQTVLDGYFQTVRLQPAPR